MLYSMKDRDYFQNLEELVSLESQVEAVRLQHKLGKKKFHEDMKKVAEPVSKSLESISQDITKTITESSIKNNKALENLKEKILKIKNDRGILVSYLMSPLSKITNPENTSQFELVKYSSSNRVNDLLIHNTIPITLHSNLLVFRDTKKVFELKGDLLKKPITICLSSDPDVLCNRLKFLLQEKPTGNNSDLINDEIVAMVDKLIEYKCITKNQHKQILI